MCITNTKARLFLDNTTMIPIIVPMETTALVRSMVNKIVDLFVQDK